MKFFMPLFLLAFSVQFAFAQHGDPDKNHFVATIKKGKTTINVEHLNKETPSGQPILDFRIISSKNGTYKFLIQEIKDRKGRVNRFIPLKEQNGMLYADLERSSSFVDCWLMACSTCEEGVSGSGSAWCECSVGGCEQADTSDNARDIVEKLYL
jgi:hypothetical protein